jgi:Ser/Thr protein kinase RdoA (MazF antagonist)
MRLSTLWTVDRTIEPSGSSPVAREIVAGWTHDPESLQFFRSSANFLYLFSDTGRRYFLRFADSTERSRQAVASEVALLRWLAAAGMAVALPVRSRRGQAVETVSTAWGTFHAVVFPAIAGSQLDLEELTPAQAHAWGATLGRLHATATSCPGEITAARPTWRDELDRARRFLPADIPLIQQEGDRLIAELDALPVSHSTFGLTHLDVELDNLVWGEGTIHTLDFDECARCWYMADIAFALRDLFHTGAGLDDPLIRSFLAGYAAHHALDEDLSARLPLFARLGNLLTYARIVRALDLGEDPAQPPWLNGLIAKLRQRQETYERSVAAPRPPSCIDS